MHKRLLFVLLLLCLNLLAGCRKKEQEKQQPSVKEYPVKVVVLNPNPYRTALFHSSTYQDVSPQITVYAPPGPELQGYLNQIKKFNARTPEPTNWKQEVYTSSDYLQKMLRQKTGNLLIVTGINSNKPRYIKAAVNAGLNVLADRPMCIRHDGFETILEAFDLAEKNDVILCDIMEKRSNIASVIQKELVNNENVFGELQNGTFDSPAIIEQSEHYLLAEGKEVSRYPAWYFDTLKKGEGIANLGVELVDQVLWKCFAGKNINYQKQTNIKSAQCWPTLISEQEFKKITGEKGFPPYLQQRLDERALLPFYGSGRIIFTTKDVFAGLTVSWSLQAPKGVKDSYRSVIRGTKARITVSQGKETNYESQLFVEPAEDADVTLLKQALAKAVAEMNREYPGLRVREQNNELQVVIPEKYYLTQEKLFTSSVKQRLEYFRENEIPEWEVLFMKAKYRIITEALTKSKTSN